MKYLPDIRTGHDDPRLLESLYQTARREGEVAEFRADLLACYEESPDNILYTAWYYRWQQAPQEDQAEARSINWKLAIPLSVVAGLIFWLLSGPRLEVADDMPYLVWVWGPIGACFVIAFLAITAGNYQRRPLLVVMGLVGAGIYAMLFITLSDREGYQTLMLLHLPLLAWIGAGLSILGLRSDHQNRFAFLIKSVEVFITGGIYLIAGGVFAGITFGLFEALGVSIPDAIMRLLLAGGFGLIPVLAVASVYDPHLSPLEQRFERGLGKLISTLMRLLLPLTLLVLIVYLFVIPFNFMEPFRNRQVLIVYNVMLFAIMGLLIGATPVRGSDLPQKHQAALRKGILAVAILTVLVSLYALSATVYRTILGGITINRLTIIGWNGINIGILALLIYKQFRAGPSAWIRSLQSVFGLGTNGYIAWTIFLTLAIPLLFK
jgi:hypothetical protein